MSKFKITYPSGLVETVDCDDWKTEDDMAMSKWGRNSYKEVRNEYGVKIELAQSEAEETAPQVDETEVPQDDVSE
jgi:hypothetical protein